LVLRGVTVSLNIQSNSGIASSGDNADNKIIHLSDSGLRAADEVACTARVAELGPHTAGRLFVGRENELAELETALADGSGVITTGLGGVGKSTLAHRYAEMHRDRYNPIWWIDAEDPREIEAGLAALARRLYPDLALIPDPDAAAWGRSWLAGHDGWLVVLDNATEPAHVADLMATAHGGRFMLTSRLTSGWEELAAPVPLGILTPRQALELLTRAVGRKELLEGAAQLCEALEYLPLAVRMAAAYMKQNTVTAEAYLTRLTSPDADVIVWTPTAGDPERTVAHIWLVSLERITASHGALAQELLHILAWLAPTDIPVQLLYGVPDSSSSEIDEALGRLSAYALITREGDAVTVHRMVQAAARHTTVREPAVVHAVDTARGSALTLIRDALPPYRDPAGWSLWRRLVPHIDALTARPGPHHGDRTMLTLLDREASYLQEQGQIARSIALFERTVTAATRILGPEEEATLAFRNNLAYAYVSAGDLDRAVPLFEQNLAESERVFGPDHPTTQAAT
jgi:Tetratricopeptide repeat/NB-ARC domain